VIREFAPDAVFSPPVENTTKGTVAHLKAPAGSIARAAEPARAAWIVFPRYEAGAATSLTPAAEGARLHAAWPRTPSITRCWARAASGPGRLIDGSASYEFRYSRSTRRSPCSSAGGGRRMSAACRCWCGCCATPAAVTGLRPGRLGPAAAPGHGADMTPILLACSRMPACSRQVPAAPRAHLEWARPLPAATPGGALRGRLQIGRALARTGLPLILLKGAAYTMAGLAPGRGRMFSDIDILVPKERLDEVEAALMLHGWASPTTTPTTSAITANGCTSCRRWSTSGAAT
jgi:hypothetical protein